MILGQLRIGARSTTYAALIVFCKNLHSWKNFYRPPVATNFKSAGVIWGGFGVILVVLECRITVCYKTICQIRNQLIASVASNWLQINLSPNRFAFWTSLLCTYILPLSCIGIDGLAVQTIFANKEQLKKMI